MARKEQCLALGTQLRTLFKIKEDFSTGVSTYDHTINENMNRSSSKSCTSSNFINLNSNIKPNLNQNNTVLIKKIEEMENSYNEILKNFESLVMKYKMFHMHTHL